ncbi:MAG: peptidoglycan DD-metalloendopeptidase family protein [Sandaracinaceae bacterium]|nr:peptidoglycan DD-metalloendopeptidase family protein [Sandaracinaceae bacterium]
MHRRRAAVALAALGTLLFVGDAWALTTPLTGGVAFPSTGEPLRLPFPAGTSVRVASGYSPSGGSSLHHYLNETGFGNDYYALDLVYDGLADGGRGMPVVAALSGTVVRAGWATAGWSNFGQRIILRHDLGDGHVYHTLYAHLNAIDGAVTEGATVRQGQVLGELGGSCMGALSCSSFSGPHLHWSIHRDSMVGGSGTGGSYGGNATVPEPIDGYEDLTRGRVLVSMNTGGPPTCGDGFCSGGETNASCPADCPICANIPAAGRVVDDTDLCFERGGNPAYWHDEADGWLSSLIWTNTTDDAAVDNHGIWNLTFDAAGRYLVEVYTDGSFAQAQRAAYRITHGGSTDVVMLDQSATDGWRSLGEHAFAAGGGQSVRLDDNTGEAFSLGRKIVFDAIRLTRADAPGTDAGVPSEDAGAPPGTDAGVPPMTDGGAPPMADAAVPPGTDGGPAPDGAVATTDAGDRPGGVTGGCACRATPGSSAPSCLLLGLLWPWLVRRRRRA